MWARILNAFVGIWLMATPSIFGLTGRAKANNVICGALAASFAVIAIWEVTRGLRWINFLIGVWLCVSVFVLGYSRDEVASGLIAGAVLVALSLFKGTVKNQMGGGWSELFDWSK